MTHKTFENRLRAIDPKFHMKRAGRGYMGIYYNGRFQLRICERDIPFWDVLRAEESKLNDHESELNPLGSYKWKRLIHRGRHSTAVELWKKRLISHTDITTLTR